MNDANTGVDVDIEGDPINYQIISGNVNGGFGIDPSTGLVTVVNNAVLGMASVHSLTIEASDGIFLETTTLDVQVLDSNQAPVVNPLSNQSIVENQFFSVTVSGYDPEGLSLNWSANNLPPGLVLNAFSGEIAGQATTPGTYLTTVTATDGAMATDMNFVINVADYASVAPIAIESSQRGLENRGIRFEAGDFDFIDPNMDQLSFIRIESIPTVGNLTLYGNPITQPQIDGSGGIQIQSSNIPQLRYVGPADTYGLDLADFQFSVSDGQNWSENPATMKLSLGAEDRLWLSTAGEVNGQSTIPGDGSGSLQLGGPILDLGDNSAGYWSEQFRPDGVTLDAVHFVNQNIQLGANGLVNLNRGDILFSPAEVGTVFDDGSAAIEIHPGDIVRFRPIASDYSNGNYEVIARVETIQGVPTSGINLNALALVEQDTVVGDRLVHGGDFLIVDSLSPNVILHLQLDQPGVPTVGAVSKLIEGFQIGIDGPITAVDLIEATTTAGGQVLSSGTILASVGSAETVGDNNLQVQEQDVFVLDVASTSYNGSVASADAAILLDGSDVGGTETEPEASIDAVSLLGSADTPAGQMTAVSTNVTIDENMVRRFGATDFVSAASVPLLTDVVITSLPDPANGILSFWGEPIVEGQVIPADELGFLVFEPVDDYSFANDFIEYQAVSASEQ